MKNNLEDNISIPNTGYFHLYDILAHYAVAIRNFIGNKFGRRYVGKVDRLHAQQILQTSHVNLRCAWWQKNVSLYKKTKPIIFLIC